MTNGNGEKTLGSILLMAGYISDDVLSLALQSAKLFNIQLGQILTDTNRISLRDLENALTAQCFMRAGCIDESLAKEVLRASHANNTTFADVAVNFFHWQPQFSEVAA